MEVRHFESHIHIVGHCAHWKAANRVKGLLLQGFQFQKISVSAADSQTDRTSKCLKEG
jgi:hypothetical protein